MAFFLLWRFIVKKSFESAQDMLTLSSFDSPTLSSLGPIQGSIIAEYGRSMVEILGTLAIIGVLSVGGIMGYSYGMDKYRANETINDVNMRGIDLVRQVSMGQTLSLSEWPTVSKAGYDISAPVLSAEGDAYFSISGVPKRVCEIVYDGIMQNQTTDVEVNGYVVDDSSACGDDNTMGFFFITNAGEGGTNPEELCKDVSCPDGSSCTHGICMSEEKPQINSQNDKYCSKNEQCGECQYCESYGYCWDVDDGTPCRNNSDKICRVGYCIEDKACTDNSECNYGYYCGKPYYGDFKNNICIQVELTPVLLDTGEEIYLSNRPVASVKDGRALCSSIHLELAANLDNRSDIARALNNIVKYSTYFYAENQSCSLSSSGDFWCSNTNDEGSWNSWIICVKKN